MKKKLIFITAGAGLAGFAGMFAFAWFTKPKPVAEAAPVAQTALSPNEAGTGDLPPQTLAAGSIPKSSMTEELLEKLVYDVREKIQDYKLKVQSLEVQEKRLRAAQDTLKKDIEEMDSLRLELAASVASLKAEQDKLSKSRIEIQAAEKANLMSMAATYDKMDAESAGKILINMAKNQNQNTGTDDAVKILYYMTERTKAKVLASIAEAEPAISAYVCQKLKQIVAAKE